MKRNKLTKLMAFMLVTSMGLSACGVQNADVEESSQSASAEKSELAVPSEETSEAKPYWEMLNDVSDTSELPDWEGDTLEINIWYAGGTAMHGGYFDVTEDNVYYNEIERVTGVKINWEECFDNGGNNIDAKLPMVIASGDMPTIIMGHDINNQMKELYENGYLLDLTKYYENGYLDQLTEKWYPMDTFDEQIYSMLRTEEGEYYRIQFGGNGLSKTFETAEAAGYNLEEFDAEYYNTYYSSPRTRIGYTTTSAVWVRDDIVTALYPDALTMDEIEDIYASGADFTEEQVYDLGLESFDDFVEFLQDVQDLVLSGEYVDKNGKQVKVTFGPHTETDNWTYGVQLPSLIQGAFGFDYFSYLDRNATEESEFIKRTIDSEEYVEYLKGMNGLVRDDIISQDSLLDNAAMYDEKLVNHSYAVTYVYNMAGEKGMGDGYRYRPVWIKNEVAEEIQAVQASKLKSYMGISGEDLSDEEVEQIIHMINYVNSTVGMKCYCWGPATAGFFTEDADGNRTLTNDELYNYLVLKQGEGENVKKWGIYTGVNAFDACSLATGGITLLTPNYLAKGTMDRVEADAYLYFSPAVFEFETAAKNDVFLSASGIDVYGTGQVIDGLATFWKSRAGFEDQMKKLLVAEDDAAFEEQLTKLREYADRNAFTKETMQEFSEFWAEINTQNLKAAGKLK